MKTLYQFGVASHFSRNAFFLGALLFFTACGSLSIDQERQLGEEQVALIASNSSLVSDETVLQYVSDLANRLLEVSAPGPHEIQLRIINSDAFSAFAVPGGNIYLTKGVIKACRNVSELASIIAHEISHVNRGHIRSTYRSFRTSQQAADFAGITLALLTGNPFIAGAGDVAANLSSDIYIGTHSREREREADTDAFNNMLQAGFDPRSQLTLLSRLQASTIGLQSAPAMLSTHPLPVERVAEVRARLQQLSEFESLEINDDGELEIIQARL